MPVCGTNVVHPHGLKKLSCVFLTNIIYHSDYLTNIATVFWKSYNVRK